MKCKECNKGNNLQLGQELHVDLCTAKWEAKHIPENQKKELSVCPHCGKHFFYWQNASLHAYENKHFGSYEV